MVIAFALNMLRLFKAIHRSWSAPSFRASLVLVLLILLSGTLFFHSVEGWPLIDSLYFAVTTASTVGGSDLQPQTDIGKLFTILFIFVGIGVFVVLLAHFAKALLSSDSDTNGSDDAG